MNLVSKEYQNGIKMVSMPLVSFFRYQGGYIIPPDTNDTNTC
jgi:hypothetical protein